VREPLGLTPEELFDIVTLHRLHYNQATGRGVLFHMLGALSEQGQRLVLICHHLVTDGLSWGAVVTDLQRLYLGQARARAGGTYKAWVEGLIRFAATPEVEESAAPKRKPAARKPKAAAADATEEKAPKTAAPKARKPRAAKPAETEAPADAEAPADDEPKAEAPKAPRKKPAPKPTEPAAQAADDAAEKTADEGDS